jgi:hypothetical protein
VYNPHHLPSNLSKGIYSAADYVNSGLSQLPSKAAAQAAKGVNYLSEYTPLPIKSHQYFFPTYEKENMAQQQFDKLRNDFYNNTINTDEFVNDSNKYSKVFKNAQPTTASRESVFAQAPDPSITATSTATSEHAKMFLNPNSFNPSHNNERIIAHRDSEAGPSFVNQSFANNTSPGMIEPLSYDKIYEILDTLEKSTNISQIEKDNLLRLRNKIVSKKNKPDNDEPMRLGIIQRIDEILNGNTLDDEFARRLSTKITPDNESWGRLESISPLEITFDTNRVAKALSVDNNSRKKPSTKFTVPFFFTPSNLRKNATKANAAAKAKATANATKANAAAKAKATANAAKSTAKKHAENAATKQAENERKLNSEIMSLSNKIINGNVLFAKNEVGENEFRVILKHALDMRNSNKNILGNYNGLLSKRVKQFVNDMYLSEQYKHMTEYQSLLKDTRSISDLQTIIAKFPKTPKRHYEAVSTLLSKQIESIDVCMKHANDMYDLMKYHFYVLSNIKSILKRQFERKCNELTITIPSDYGELNEVKELVCLWKRATEQKPRRWGFGGSKTIKII